MIFCSVKYVYLNSQRKLQPWTKQVIIQMLINLKLKKETYKSSLTIVPAHLINVFAHSLAQDFMQLPVVWQKACMIMPRTQEKYTLTQPIPILTVQHVFLSIKRQRQEVRKVIGEQLFCHNKHSTI